MLSMLVAVALLKELIKPELKRLTVPPALLVMPTIVPVPLRFIVPVFVKLARAVLMGPGPVLVKVPALAKTLMDDSPPKLKAPAALLVNAPVP